MLVFHLEHMTGVPPYLQLVQQVRNALLLGYLQPGDQLPLIREVVATLAINPNTVSKAYRLLEQEGRVSARPGIGTFVTDQPRSMVSASAYTSLRRELERWLRRAYGAGLDAQAVTALVSTTQRELGAEEAA
jgi:GntR family transcriptional regulator